MKTILPIVAQYFSDVGVKHGILEFIEQQDDSAGGLFANIKYELEPHELELQKLTSLGSDNTNVNVDPKHSVFSLFKELVPLLMNVHFFWKNILVEVQQANILLQKHYATGIHLYGIIKDLLCKLNNRLRDDYFGSKVMGLLGTIQDSNEVDDLKKSFRLFIRTIIAYIEDYFVDRTSFYEFISIFSEVDIQKLEWRNIECCAACIDPKKINKDLLYNQFNHLKSKFIQLKDKFEVIDKQVQEFISSNFHLYKQGEIMSHGEVKLCSDDECDVEAEFGSDDDDNIRHHKNHRKNLHIRCDYLWAYLLHASNDFREIIFSHMKYLWNNNRSSMKHDLISAELKIKVNTQYNGSEFYDHLLINQDLLKQIRSSDKYTHTAKIPRTV
ncbi:unnamed protein product [Rotaria magnacalcarata]|uniref:Uncharacterized protein n=1 Tax=Rotaria magnacalcarata TaxID=392030 RepID=A0A8S2PYY9_9BILA|nr:unnamed protein product [Rotaria magnacalcarata]